MITTARVRLGAGEELYLIGESCRSSAPPRGVPGVWVRLEQTGEIFITDDAGRFRIPRIGAGIYKLRARAVGFKEGALDFTVPQPDGVYDIKLTPLP